MKKVIFLVIALVITVVQTNGTNTFPYSEYPHVRNNVKPNISFSTDEKPLKAIIAENSINADLNSSINEYYSVNAKVTGLPTIPNSPIAPTVTNNCGSTVLTRGTPPDGVTWYWQGTSSNGTFTNMAGSTYPVNYDGTYYIRAKDNTTNEWSTTSTGVAVVIRVVPKVPTPPSLTNSCGSSLLTRTDPATNTTWYWQGTNSSGESIDNSNTTYTVTADGTYYIRARNNTSGCWSTISSSVSVTIAKLPVAPSNPTITSNSCGGSVLTMGTSPSGVNWYWQGANINGTSKSNANSTYTATDDGTYYLRAYNASNSCWSEVSASITVDINELPAVPSTPTIVTSSCEGIKLGHSASPAGITWYWQGTASLGTSTVNSDATYDLSSNGTYYIRSRNDATGCWSSTNASLIINSINLPVQPTTPTITSNICGSSVLTRVASPADVTWYWQGQNANGTSVYNSESTLTVTTDGKYYIRAKNNTTGCWSVSSAVTVDVQDIPTAPTTPIITSSSCGSVVITKGNPPSGTIWYWQGTNGNGTTNNTNQSSNTNYTVTASGTYYLRAHNGCWGLSTSVIVNVGTPDVPTTPIVVSSSCEKIILSITGTPPVGTTWYWQGKNNAGTSTENSNNTFEATSNGTYCLRARNNTTGCWSTISSTLVINSFNLPLQPTTPTITSSVMLVWI